MHFQALPVLATVLALPYLAFGEPTCYNSDVWKDEAARSEAAHAIDKWCNNLAPSTWEPRRERKQCLEVDYSPHNVNLWMNNGNLGDATITVDQCKKLLKKIVDTCPGGGYDHTKDGWKSKAVPNYWCMV
ncbi:hypothetical protein COH20_005511 [Aspergillus flavus]|nr:hypothetical protein COH21_006966 [Aspergillus flavus]RAQ56819.1 hypothetical protein COH20_005511 [Aspergillus flavus]